MKKTTPRYHIHLALAGLLSAAAPATALADSESPVSISVGPAVGIPSGAVADLVVYTFGFHAAGALHIAGGLSGVVSFDFAGAQKTENLSQDVTLVLYGVDGGFRYAVDTQRGVPVFAELLAGSHTSRYADNMVTTQTGFGLRAGLGIIIDLGRDFYLAPQASYNTTFLDEVNQDFFLLETTVGFRP